MSEFEKFPSQLAERFQIRLPDGMRDKLREAAEANNRSMNAEIVARLARSLEENRIAPDDITDVNKLSVFAKLSDMYSELCSKIESEAERIEKETRKLELEINTLRKTDRKSAIGLQTKLDSLRKTRIIDAT